MAKLACAVLVVALFSACADEGLDEPDAGPVGDLGLWAVETTYDSCDSPLTPEKAPLMLTVEFREGETSVGTALVTQGNVTEATPWGWIGDTIWFLHLELPHDGLVWNAGPVKLVRNAEGGWVGAVSWHSHIGPRCRGTITLTRP